MSQAIISRRGGGSGSGYVTITFNGVSALKKTDVAALSTSRNRLASTTVGNYALFGGGNNDNAHVSTVDAYNTSLTRTTPTTLNSASSLLAATTVGNYALFAGGYASYTSVVAAYNTSLTRSTPTALSEAKATLSATTVGNYALFGGGYNGKYLSTVDAYYVNNKVQVYPGTKYKLGSMASESTSSTMQEIETTAPITGYIKIKDATIN